MLDTTAAGQMQNAERRCTDTQRLLKTEALLQLLSYLRMKNEWGGVCYVNMGLANVSVDWISYLESDSCLVPERCSEIHDCRYRIQYPWRSSPCWAASVGDEVLPEWQIPYYSHLWDGSNFKHREGSVSIWR
jgi:hypothetical protein